MDPAEEEEEEEEAEEESAEATAALLGTFQDEFAKEILEEASSDVWHRPKPGDLVSVEISVEGERRLWRTWTVAQPSADPPVYAGVDVDRCVRTMRRGELCSVKPRRPPVPVQAPVLLRLVTAESSEDLLGDGRLRRITVREGSGWQTPRGGMELKVRLGWRTVPSKGPFGPSEASDPQLQPCDLLLRAELPPDDSAEWRALETLRRALAKAFGAVVSRIATEEERAGVSPDSGPVLRISRGTQVLAGGEGCSRGLAPAEALARCEAAVGQASYTEVCRDPRELCIKVEEPVLDGDIVDAGSVPVMGDLSNAPPDWLPGHVGRLGLQDLRAGQRCFVCASADVAFGPAGRPECGIPPDATLEYELEMIKLMPIEDVSLDYSKRVLKKITREGEGYDKPTEGVEVKVRFEALDATSGAVLVEERQLAFPLACGRHCSAFEETVLTMKRGEAAEVRCSDPEAVADPELGLQLRRGGDCVVLLLELLDFEKVDLYRGTDAAQTLAHCIKRKEVGGLFFKQGNWRRALKRYQHVAKISPYLDHASDEATRTEALSVRKLCNLNAAACHLKLEAWRDAARDCSLVLQEDANNVKALFRHGHALKELAEYAEAERSLRKAVELDKENREARNLLIQVKQAMKAEIGREKQVFSRMMAGGGSEPAAASTERRQALGKEALAAEEPRHPADGADAGAEVETDFDSWDWGIMALLATSALAVGAYMLLKRWGPGSGGPFSRSAALP